MATLKFKPDELLKKMRIKKYAADELIKNNKQEVAANTERMAADWYKNWKKQNGIPGDSNALPPVDSVPTWARPHLFPRAEATPREGLKIANDKIDSSIMRYVTEKGFFLDGQGRSYMQGGGKFEDAGEYDLDIHGLPVPLAEKQARNGLKIAQNFSPADVPLCDGVIYEAKNKMPQNLKHKYDMMLENGMMSEEEYHKQMQRTMGTKK